MKRLLILAYLLLSFSPAYAEGEGATLEETLAEDIKHDPHDKFITLAFENDSIGGGDDHNYTNGFRLTFFDIGAKFPKIAHQLADAVPTFSINETSSIFYSAGQNLYTPENISSTVQVPGDRPWAAFLYGSMGMSTLTDNHIDDLEATLGFVGPMALGEPVQRTVHKHITDSPIPRGWDNQLKNEPGVILSWQRRWPTAARYDTKTRALTAAPYFGISLGNIHTYANTGISFNFNPLKSGWSDMPLRVRPALPGTGFFSIPDAGWDWQVFGGIEGRAVARNIFLDGNSFRDSHSVDKFPLIGDANAGVAVTFGQTRLSYTLVYRTPEFQEQEDGTFFGAVSLAYRF